MYLKRKHNVLNEIIIIIHYFGMIVGTYLFNCQGSVKVGCWIVHAVSFSWVNALLRCVVMTFRREKKQFESLLYLELYRIADAERERAEGRGAFKVLAQTNGLVKRSPLDRVPAPRWVLS